MVRYYVYLNISEKRLLICDNIIRSENYSSLMDSYNYDACKLFCIGYIAGCKGIEVTNDLKEFNV